MSTPWDENAVAPITHPGEPAREQVVGVMVRLHLPEDAVPEDAIENLRSSIEFGKAEVSLAYVLAPPPPYGPLPAGRFT